MTQKMNTFMRFAADRKSKVTSFSGENVKTIEGYAVLNFEDVSYNSFRYIEKTFRDGGGGGHGR